MIYTIEYTGDLCPINQKFISRNFVLSPRYRIFKNEFSNYLRSVWKRDPILTEISIGWKIAYPIKNVDIDAFFKSVQDCLQGIIIKDDRQIFKYDYVTILRGLPAHITLTINDYLPR